MAGTMGEDRRPVKVRLATQRSAWQSQNLARPHRL